MNDRSVRDRVMQVGDEGVARESDLTDHLTLHDALSLLHPHASRFQVKQITVFTIAVIDRNVVAQPRGIIRSGSRSVERPSGRETRSPRSCWSPR